MIIRLKVFEQTLSIVSPKSIPRQGSKDYLVLQFLFSPDWDGLGKLCYLQRGEVSQPIDVVDGLVEVPEWFTQQDGFEVTLFGKSGSQEVPTNVVSLLLEKSNTLWEQDAPEPQPSWLAKVIDMNNHPPIPGDNGYWLLWDTDSGAYVESELPLPAVSVGPQGPQGEPGPAGSDATVTKENIEAALGYTPADSAALSGKQDKPIIKTAMDAIAVAGAKYYLGDQTAVTIVLPDNAEVGQEIEVVWYNGSTAATLSITGTMLPCDYVPSANSRSEINTMWDGRYWSVLTAESAVDA